MGSMLWQLSSNGGAVVFEEGWYYTDFKQRTLEENVNPRQSSQPI